MMQALVAVFLVRCLIKSGYLQEENKNEMTDNQLFFAKLIHHFMRVAYYNSHEMTRIDPLTLEVIRIGRATNPSLALINHSCDPNYRRVNIDNRTIGFAARPIKAGTEISDTYSQIFATSCKEERRTALKKYNFVCDCKACSSKWPTLSVLRKSSKKAAVSEAESKALIKLKIKCSRAKNVDQKLSLQCDLVSELWKTLSDNQGMPNPDIIEAEHGLYLAYLRSVVA